MSMPFVEIFVEKIEKNRFIYKYLSVGITIGWAEMGFDEFMRK